MNETVLEMHYHSTIMDAFRTVFGVGGSRAFHFYKYSPQRESYVGFDQAYARTELSEEELFSRLSDAASNDNYRLSDRFLGYFLQFKVVQRMVRRSRHTPDEVTTRPHYRSSLDTARKARSRASQHELLFYLNQNAGAMVYYACPMLFDRADLYNEEVDVDRLRLVDVASCPSAYTDNERHFIYFEDVDTVPIWRSEPTEGEAIDVSSFVNVAARRILEADPRESAQKLLTILKTPSVAGFDSGEHPPTDHEGSPLASELHEALTIIHLSESDVEGS